MFFPIESKQRLLEPFHFTVRTDEKCVIWGLELYCLLIFVMNSCTVKYKDKKTLYTIDLSEVAIRRNRQLFWKGLVNKFNKKICYRFIQPYKSPSIDFRSKPIDWCIYNGMNLWDQGIYKSRSYWSKNQTKLDDILLCIAFSSVTLFIDLLIYLLICFQFIYGWQILFQLTIRLAFHSQQGLSQTSGAISNIAECWYRWHQTFETESPFVVLIKVNINQNRNVKRK